MKKLVFGLIAFVSLANLSFGQARLVSKDLEFVGIQHNQYLQSFYNKAVAEKWTSADKQKATTFLVAEITKNSKSVEEANMATELINQRMSAPCTDPQTHSDMFYPGLPDKIKKHLSSLDKIINGDTGASELAEFQKQVIALENTIDKDASLINKDLLVLYTATNVAKYSAAYWDKNRDNWILAGNTNSTVAAKMGPGGRILGMDVAGGAGAAATTWVLNAAPGAGQIAYGSAIVGGAVGGSVAQGVYELWDWAFGG